MFAMKQGYVQPGSHDASEIVIEVLCKYFCRRLPFVYDSYDVDRGFQVSGRHCQCHRRQDRRNIVD